MFKIATLITPTLTFFAGLTAGALVFSAPGEQQPETAPLTDPGQAPAARALTVKSGEEESTEAATAATAEPEVEPSVAAPPPEFVERIDRISDAWGRMQSELADLRQRVAMLERRPVPAAAAEREGDDRPRRARTPEQQRDALVQAGVAIDVAEDLVLRRSEVSLRRLELRDRAIREGWINSDRYREELQRINADRVSVRDEVGPEVYDRFLYETGSDNRVLVDAVIPGSAGDQNGLMPGDVVERYAETAIFDPRDLRNATSDGISGELVPVQVRREGELQEIWLPRGPIGIQLETARIEPRG
ncbi:MAG: hypothetical protein GVY22_09980 [Gammaproteobacteria bacterium]|jgi:hypothetical protein|nr:hypothetical protein [Gammaproteobacteria bacterium]